MTEREAAAKVRALILEGAEAARQEYRAYIAVRDLAKASDAIARMRALEAEAGPLLKPFVGEEIA
jgi:hypothetical protein